LELIIATTIFIKIIVQNKKIHLRGIEHGVSVSQDKSEILFQQIFILYVSHENAE